MHFYISFSRELIRMNQNDNAGNHGSADTESTYLEILRKALKNIGDEDIEIFVHFNPEVAIQIVNDLLDEPANNAANGLGPSGMHNPIFASNSGGKSSLSTAIDKETKGLAMRIKKYPHYKSYKAYQMQGSFVLR